MATEADLIQKFKDLAIPVGADFEELIHAAFSGANLADLVNNYDSRITMVENDLATKADDSKVVHDNHDGTEQLNGVQVQPFNKLSDSVGGRNLLPGTSGKLQTVTNASGWNNNLPAIAPVTTTIDSDTTYTARTWISPASHNMNIQIVWQDSSGATRYGSGNNVSAGTSGYSTWTGTITAGSTIQRVKIVFGELQSTPSSVSYKEMHLEQGSIATDWTPAPEDKADDSKVVHNSGNEEIGGQKTFDTAPIDKTTGNPYSTKSDVTTAISTATANMVDSSKPTNFTAGLQSGGVDVATAADLKSIEDSAWNIATFPYGDPNDTNKNSTNVTVIYKNDYENKKIMFIIYGSLSVSSSQKAYGANILDFSLINKEVNSQTILESDGYSFIMDKDDSLYQVQNSTVLPDNWIMSRFYGSIFTLTTSNGTPFYTQSPVACRYSHQYNSNIYNVVKYSN